MKEVLDLDRQVALFEQVLAAVRRRRCVSEEEGDEFVSWARERFVVSREAIFERFRGESKASTYLTVVIVNQLRDFRRERWGKWRPSAAAHRMGVVAIRLEQLVSRDGFSVEEAIGTLRHNEGAWASVEELRAMAARLPERAGRRVEDERVLEHVASADSADERVEAHETRRAADRIERALEAAFGRLEDEDRLILQLHVGKGMSVADVSRSLHLEQKPLYRRLHQLLARLRRDLESQGVAGDDVQGLLGAKDGALHLRDMHDDESLPPGPSEGVGT